MPGSLRNRVLALPDNGGMDPRPVYDVMGVGYSATRHEDPRIARAIWDALGDATSVANIGRGRATTSPVTGR